MLKKLENSMFFSRGADLKEFFNFLSSIYVGKGEKNFSYALKLILLHKSVEVSTLPSFNFFPRLLE